MDKREDSIQNGPKSKFLSVIEKHYWELLDEYGLRHFASLDEDELRRIRARIPESLLRKATTVPAYKLKKSLLQDIFSYWIFPVRHYQLQERTTEIAHIFRNAGYDVGVDVFTGLFPTGTFNALVQRKGPGYLILLNFGVEELIGRTMAILVKYPELTDRVRHLAELIANFVFFSDPMASNFHNLWNLTALWVLIMEDLSVNFLLAHEYAHIVARHLNNAPYCFHKTPVGEMESCGNTDEQECEADLIAAKVLIDNNLKGSNKSQSDFRMATDAILFTLQLQTTVEKAYSFVRTKKKDLQELPVNPQLNIRIERLKDFFMSYASKLGHDFTLDPALTSKMDTTTYFMLEDDWKNKYFRKAAKKATKHSAYEVLVRKPECPATYPYT